MFRPSLKEQNKNIDWHAWSNSLDGPQDLVAGTPDDLTKSWPAASGRAQMWFAPTPVFRHPYKLVTF
jgi:hypothetical protein